MERVAWLLDPRNERHSYRHALVRLWIQASNDQLLTRWEQQENERSMASHVDGFIDMLQDEQPIPVDAIEAHPLALIRALDDYLAATRLSTSQSTPISQAAFLFEEDARGYWLVAVILAARRAAAMNHQPARLARWFHHHAVLPSRTAHGIEVTCVPARSGLHTCLQSLANRADGTLKAWVAHFTDGADVVWDRNISPIGNWRARSVEPHAWRHASMVQTLEEAALAGAQVVVFPEFTLDVQHQQQLVAYMRKNPNCIQLVIAGAFHTEDATTAHPITYNTAPVLTSSGRLVFSHRKLRLFGRDNVGTEYAEIGNRLHVLVTPIGCMTVLICKDFLDEDPRVDNLLAEVPVDWVWVPSYGDQTTLNLHKDRARRLATITVGTSCAVAQTQNTALKKDGETLALLPGFAHAAGHKSPCDVPTTGGLVEFALAIQPPPTKRTAPALKQVK